MNPHYPSNYATVSAGLVGPSWLLGAVLFVFSILALFYSIAIPPGEGVDEIPHLEYVRYVKENRALPIQPTSRDGGVKVWMGHHPPLYYVLGALATSSIDMSDWNDVFRPNPHFVWRENDGADGWNVFMHFGQDGFPWQGSVLALHIMRLASLLLGAVAVFAVFRASEILFEGNRWLATGATTVVAFNPSFLFMSSTVHHDVLQAAIFALGAWWLMVLLKHSQHGSWFYIAGGLLAASAMLTKLSGLALLVVMGLALCMKAFRQRNLGWLIRRAGLMLGVVILVAGWWYARNQLLYNDPLGWQMFLAVHAHMVRPGPYTWSEFTGDFLAQVSRTFWGAFGYMHITFPGYSRFLWAMTGVAMVGLVLGLARRQIDLKRQWAEWAVAVGILVVLFASFVRFSVATLGAGHGRYLFPAAFSIGALFVAGLRGFAGRRLQPVISLAVAAGLAAYAIWLPLTQVLPKYAGPAVLAANSAPALLDLPAIQVTEGVELSYRLEVDRVVPGRPVPVTLYWRATGDPSVRQDPQVRLELIDETGESIDAKLLWPAPGLSPDVWPAGQWLVSRVHLYPPPSLAANEVTLAVTPVLRVQGQPAELDRMTLTSLPTTGGVSQVDSASIPNLRQEVLASEIKLRGYDAGTTRFAPGATVPLDLYWEVLQKPAANYTVFIHLVNDRGEQVSGFDRPAGGEKLPTTAWEPGWVLRDSYPLTIPEGLAPGEYTLLAGMYIWPSLERLPIAIEGKPAGDSIELDRIVVGP